MRTAQESYAEGFVGAKVSRRSPSMPDVTIPIAGKETEWLLLEILRELKQLNATLSGSKV